MRTVVVASAIFIFWFMLSGHTETLLIGLGVLSTMISLYFARRMDIIDHESYPFHLSLRLLHYYFYLGAEIIKSNIDVAKRILTLGPVNISPQVVTLRASKETDLSKVIYANAITLTPGTVTLKLSDDEIEVHSLSKEGVAHLKSGEMAKAVPDMPEHTL